MTSAQTPLRTDARTSPHDQASEARERFRPTAYAVISTTSNAAGPTPAMNRSAIDVCVMTPYRISGMLGGTMMPRVPAAHSAPMANDRG